MSLIDENYTKIQSYVNICIRARVRILSVIGKGIYSIRHMLQKYTSYFQYPVSVEG